MLPPSVLRTLMGIWQRRHGATFDDQAGQAYGDLRLLPNPNYFDDVPAGGQQEYGDLRLLPNLGAYHAPDTPLPGYGQPPDPGAYQALDGRSPGYGQPPDPTRYDEARAAGRHEPQDDAHPEQRPVSASHGYAGYGSIPRYLPARQRTDGSRDSTPSPQPAQAGMTTAEAMEILSRSREQQGHSGLREHGQTGYLDGERFPNPLIAETLPTREEGSVEPDEGEAEPGEGEAGEE